MSDDERDIKVAARRWEHFFGLCDRFEKRGDPLIEIGEIVDWLIALNPTLTHKSLAVRFVLSAKHGGLGWRHYGDKRRAVAKLLDLTNLGGFAAGGYPLRPSVFTVELFHENMRMPRSVLVEWLRAHDLSVPRELTYSVGSEGRGSAAGAAAAAAFSAVKATPALWLLAEAKKAFPKVLLQKQLVSDCITHFKALDITVPVREALAAHRSLPKQFRYGRGEYERGKRSQAGSAPRKS